MATTLDQMPAPRNHFSAEAPPTRPAAAEALCAVAAATDVLGDRWTMFLVRDLLWHGAQSATALARRNLGLDVTEVIDRLERLEDAGLVEPHATDRDIGYRLTALGRAAEGVIRALHGFGLEIVRRRPITTAMIRQTVTLAAVDRHDDVVRSETSAVVGLDVSGRRTGVVLAPGILRTDDAAAPDVDVACTQDVFIDLLCGLLGVDEAIRCGELEVRGPVGPVAVLFDLLARPVLHRVEEPDRPGRWRGADRHG